MKKQFLTLLAGSLICLSSSSIFAQNSFPSSGPAVVQNANGKTTTLEGENIKFSQGYQRVRFGNDNTYITGTGLNTTGHNTDGWLILGSSTTATDNEVMYVKPYEVAFNYDARINADKRLRFGSNDKIFIYGDEYVPGGSNGGTLLIGTNASPQIFLTSQGMGLGTYVSPNYKLAVDGKITCRGLKIQIPQGTAAPNWTWPDYVFAKTYKLKPLSEVEAYIEKESHLPDVPSAKEVSENGIETAEMLKIQMQKIEELTLYIIDLQKQIEALKK